MGLLSAFKRVSIYVNISRNNIEIINLENGDSAKQTAHETFSTNRFIIADFNKANDHIKNVMADLFPKKSILPRQYKVIIQQTEPVEGALSAIELRALRDLAKITGKGSTPVIVLEHSNKISKEEASELPSAK